MRKFSIWGRWDLSYGSISLWKRRLACERAILQDMSHCCITARHSPLRQAWERHEGKRGGLVVGCAHFGWLSLGGGVESSDWTGI